jgi:hypothetical protein
MIWIVFLFVSFSFRNISAKEAPPTYYVPPHSPHPPSPLRGTAFYFQREGPLGESSAARTILIKLVRAEERKKQDGWMNNESFFLLFYSRTGLALDWTTYLCTNKRRTNLWIGFRILLYDDEEFNHFSGRETLTTLLNQSNQDYIHSRLSQPRLGNCTVGWSFLDLLLLNQMIIHSTKSFHRSTKDLAINQSAAIGKLRGLLYFFRLEIWILSSKMISSTLPTEFNLQFFLIY